MNSVLTLDIEFSACEILICVVSPDDARIIIDCNVMHFHVCLYFFFVFFPINLGNRPPFSFLIK